MSSDYKHRFDFPIKEFAYSLYRIGARKEELLYIELDDFNPGTGKWVIQPKKCPMRYGGTWRPKGGKTRVAYIPKDVLELWEPLFKRLQNHKVVGYTPNKEGLMTPSSANFLFTMLDRSLSKKYGESIYRRIDQLRAGWGALFLSAGYGSSKMGSSSSTTKYKNDEKKRTDVSVPYTRHDMRRGFNVEAKSAGMTLEERSLLLGHSQEVNEVHYCGEDLPELAFDSDRLAILIDEKMKVCV